MREVVEDLNSCTVDGMSLANRSLIICGLIPSNDGVWRVQQLNEDLRKIVEDNRPYFDGQRPEI